MNEGQAVLNGQGAEPGQGQAQPLQLAEQTPVRQARSLRPRYRIMVQLTRIDDDHEQPEPVAHWAEGRYRTPEAADLDAAAIYAEDYLTMPGVIGHVVVVQLTPGERPVMATPRHFPEV